MIYQKGHIIPNFIQHAEGLHFDLDDAGATLLVFFQNPSSEEIKQFSSGHAFEIRFTEMKNVIMITAKIGSLAWMDAPYTPHLSKNLSQFTIPGEQQGLALTLVLVDAVSGTVKHIRLLGLSERFTKKLFGAVMEEKMNSFDMKTYNEKIQSIFAAYSTKEIVKLSSDYCKLN